MEVTIKGTLAAVKAKYPQQGQNFDSHQVLSVTQISDDELEVIKIKDMDPARKHQENQPVICKCSVNHWQMGNRGGLSVKLIDIKPLSSGSAKAA